VLYNFESYNYILNNLIINNDNNYFISFKYNDKEYKYLLLNIQNLYIDKNTNSINNINSYYILKLSDILIVTESYKYYIISNMLIDTYVYNKNLYFEDINKKNIKDLNIYKLEKNIIDDIKNNIFNID
jgi:hypothetical protein